MATLDSLEKRIAVAVDDPAQKWCKDAYIRPFLNTKWEDLYVELATYNINWPKRRVELLAVPANTADLSGYQGDNNPLAAMIVPTLIEWKKAGDPARNYKEVLLTDELPDIDATVGNLYYTMRDDGIIYITQSTVVTDIRVSHDAQPADFNDLGNTVINGVRSVLAYATAEMIAGTRGMPLADRHMRDYTLAKENLEILLVKRKQRIPYRIGSQNRQRRARAARAIFA
jgi:hypothetical protein